MTKNVRQIDSVRPIQSAFVNVAIFSGRGRLFKMSGDLWEALRGKDISAMRNLLESGASIESATKTDGWALLHAAAYTKGNLRMVKLLLEHKADVNAKYFFWLCLNAFVK